MSDVSEALERHPRRRMALAAAGGLLAGVAGGVAVARSSMQPGAVALDGLRRYQDKVVLITGGTSGIGRAAVEAFAREGARVAFCGRREALGREVQRSVSAAGGEAFYIRADVRDEQQVRAFVETTVSHYGGIDVAMNNAGITQEKPLHEFSAEEWDDILGTNLRGVFLSMKHEIPAMLARGGGTIVVTSSLVAHLTAAGRSAYTASKAGLLGLVRAAALDYGAQGIRINAVLPGTTDTALVRRVAGMESMPDAVWEIGAAQWGRSHVPGLHRMATPKEIADFIVTICSPELRYLTGASLPIDGGTGAG